MYSKKFSNDLGIIIPAFNEDKTIKKTVTKASKFGEVLVINDCSKDKTLSILKKNKIKFLNNSKRLGYENSIIRGINFFLLKKKYLITFDGDLQFYPKDIYKLYKYITYKKLDIVIGNRIKKNRFIENILSFVFKKKFYLDDPISGLKIYKAKSLKKIIRKTKNNYFLVDIICNGLKKGLNINNKIIKTRKRLDNPRIGNFIKANKKIFKIILFVLLFNIKIK